MTSYDVRSAQYISLISSKHRFDKCERLLQCKRCPSNYMENVRSLFGICTEHLLRRKSCSIHFVTIHFVNANTFSTSMSVSHCIKDAHHVVLLTPDHFLRYVLSNNEAVRLIKFRLTP